MEKLKGYIKEDNLDKQLISDTITKINTAQNRADSAYNLANSKQDKLTISSNTTSTSTTQVANSYAVKQAMDKANEAFQFASDGKKEISNAINTKGGSTNSTDSFHMLAEKIKNLNTGGSATTKPFETHLTIDSGQSQTLFATEFNNTVSFICEDPHYDSNLSTDSRSSGDRGDLNIYVNDALIGYANYSGSNDKKIHRLECIRIGDNKFLASIHFYDHKYNDVITNTIKSISDYGKPPYTFKLTTDTSKVSTGYVRMNGVFYIN